MRLNIKYPAIYITILSLFFFSCDPRVDLDDSVWGNTAEITAVSLFEYIEVTNQLGLNEPVTGIQQRSVSATVVINKDNAGISGTIGENPTVTITVASTVDLTKIGIRFSHFAKNITPVEGAVAAGVIGDFSKGPYKYKLLSADGSVRYWTIKFVKL